MITWVLWILHQFFVFPYWNQSMVRFPWTLAVRNSGDLQRRRLQLRKGRTDRKTLPPCPSGLSVAGSGCHFVHNSLETTKKTHWSQTQNMPTKRMSLIYSVYYQELKKKKGRKIEWLHCTKEACVPETQRGEQHWMDAPCRLPPHTEKQICIDTQYFLLLWKLLGSASMPGPLWLAYCVIEESKKRESSK